jgi:type I restriction enzyme, S subunit
MDEGAGHVTMQLRYLADVLVSNVDKKAAEDQASVRLVNYTNVYYRDQITSDLDLMKSTASLDQIARFRVLPGDSIITKDSESADDIGIATHVSEADANMVCGYHLAIVRPRERTDPRYLTWALRSDLARGQFTVAANGMTRYGLTYGAIQAVELPSPPVAEQRQIAEFLDDQVARIDNVLAARRIQAELVVAERRSRVHFAVTGGQAVRRQPSRLAWADTIPDHWSSVRVCQVARIGTGHTPSRSKPEYWIGTDVPWLTTSDVYRFRFDQIDSIEDTEVHISRLGLENSAAVIHPAGTVGLSRTSASAGFAIHMAVPMATSQDFATWTPGPLLDGRFLLWCLRSMHHDLMGRLAMGSTHKTIYFPELMSIRIPLPPRPEQEAIVRAIQHAVDAARWNSSALTRSIGLLEELKRSLITAAVTGEFDVSSADGSRVGA